MVCTIDAKVIERIWWWIEEKQVKVTVDCNIGPQKIARLYTIDSNRPTFDWVVQRRYAAAPQAKIFAILA